MKKNIINNTEGIYLGSFKPLIIAALTISGLSTEILAEPKKKDNNSSRTGGGGYNPILMNTLHQNNLNAVTRTTKTTKTTYFKTTTSNSSPKSGGSFGG